MPKSTVHVQFNATKCSNMLLKFISLIFLINVSFLRPLDCKTMIELNETSAFLSIQSMLTDLK